MASFSVRIAVFAAALVPLCAAPALAARDRAAPQVAASYAPGRVIVEWQPGTTRSERLAARDQAGASFVRRLGPTTRFQLLHVEPGQTVSDAVRALNDEADVRLAGRDGYAVPLSVPNDPLFDQLWGLEAIGAPAAWDRSTGSPSTVVADLDTGYRFDHPELGPVAWTNGAEIPGNGVDDDGNGFVDDLHGWDFVGPDSANAAYPGDADPTDDDVLTGGHGVHTAGTIGAAGNNGVGITGVAQNVRIMPLRVCGYSSDVAGVVCPDSAQIEAIEYAAANGARAANMSFGGSTADPLVLHALAAHPGVLFVVAAGNSGHDNDTTPTYPCNDDPATSGVPGAIDNVICVAATDQSDQLASFSNRGHVSVDLGAPGVNVLSTFPLYSPDTFLSDDFETNDFASKWTPTVGADGGFGRTNESPLTSFGMSDTPGRSLLPLETRSSTSATVTLPPGYSGCTITQDRTLHLGTGGSYSYSLQLDGSTIATANATSPGPGSFQFDVLDTALTSGGDLQLRLTFQAGATPTAADGVWLDDVGLTCTKPSTFTAGYEVLDGTSMATPHVTGAAALLFSLKPGATVPEVRTALLDGVDPLTSLTGKTVTGGRLDVARSMALLAPVGQPTRSQTGTGAPGGATSSGETRIPRPVRCVVPRLVGKRLRAARRALRRGHCRLGLTVRPAAQRHRLRSSGLVVKRSRPRAGKVRPSGAKVKLVLGPRATHQHRR
ncbi:MAG TPA: S8 family serine peptidase [Conexibacter sp.]|nr:S8 family serine peptidase [Conexibacter sp.]